MAHGFAQQGADDCLPGTTSASAGRNSNRANLAQVRAVNMQRAAADDPSAILDNDEVANVLADVAERARQECAVA
jgi:hypothetical protein